MLSLPLSKEFMLRFFSTLHRKGALVFAALTLAFMSTSAWPQEFADANCPVTASAESALSSLWLSPSGSLNSPAGAVGLEDNWVTTARYSLPPPPAGFTRSATSAESSSLVLTHSNTHDFASSSASSASWPAPWATNHATSSALERTPEGLQDQTGTLSAKETLTSYISSTFGKSKAVALRIVNAVYAEASRGGVPPLLALAIIEKESRYAADAVNSSGATGLMQVIKRFHMDKLKNDPSGQGLSNPETNVRVGVSVFSEFLARTGGNIKQALTRYSGGSTAYAAQVQSVQGKLQKLVQESERPAEPVRVLSAAPKQPAWCETTAVAQRPEF